MISWECSPIIGEGKIMANSHPYISGSGNIAKMVNHLRNSFPPTVTSDTVKKLGIASNNESYVINALQFVGVIDDEGKRTADANKAFNSHKDEDFQKSFKSLVQIAYKDLFDLHGEKGWELSKDDLITFLENRTTQARQLEHDKLQLSKYSAPFLAMEKFPLPKLQAPRKAQTNPRPQSLNANLREQTPIRPNIQ